MVEPKKDSEAVKYVRADRISTADPGKPSERRRRRDQRSGGVD